MTSMSETSNGRTVGKRTLVDEGTELKGTINSTCPVVVAGRVEGDISGPAVEIAEKGFVSGTVKAAEVISRGEIFGQIEAENLELSGKIRDGTVIRARSLDIKVGRQGPREPIQFGECELCIGDEPNKAAAIAKAMSSSGVAVNPEPEAETPADPRQVRRPGGGIQPQEPAKG
jgi:cytoskeletal protein CcmA (bactofilin family)